MRGRQPDHSSFDQPVLKQVYRVPPVPVVLEKRLPFVWQLPEMEMDELVLPTPQVGSRS